MAERELALRFAAFALGMKAQTGVIDRNDLFSACLMADSVLGKAHPLARALSGFRLQFQRAPHDIDLLKRLGRDLTRYIQTLNLPAPVDAGRKDIHG
ncbi:hypothetical protein [Marinovum algicola]|uniref:hypothetical protein n=1 Tax=Marinovum algicola TaxID=42444 RepID=UPI003B527C3A